MRRPERDFPGLLIGVIGGLLYLLPMWSTLGAAGLAQRDTSVVGTKWPGDKGAVNSCRYRSRRWDFEPAC